MTPKPLPKKYERQWRKWPTFDELRTNHPELKVHQLRSHLAKVPCFRCPDQTARYNADDAERALRDVPPPPQEPAASTATAGANGSHRPPSPPPRAARRAPDEDDEDDDDDQEIELAEPKVYDAMVLFRQCLLLVGDQRKTQIDLAAAMAEPMKLGLQLVRENTELLQTRIAGYEKVFDRMLQVTEALMSEQADRELAKAREENAQKMRAKAFDTAAGYLPTIVSNFKPTAQATAALDAILSLEPEVLDAIVDSEEANDVQRSAWSKLRDVIRGPRKAPPAQQQPDQNVSQEQQPSAA